MLQTIKITAFAFALLWLCSACAPQKLDSATVGVETDIQNTDNVNDSDTQQETQQSELEPADISTRQTQHNLADIRMRAEIVKALRSADVNFLDVNADVFEAIVLLTGRVENSTQKRTAQSITEAQTGVQQVINEVKIAKPITLERHAADERIEIWLSSNLLSDSLTIFANYIHRVVDGEVYIMGIANSYEENELVIAHASDLQGVREVKSFTRLVNDPKRLAWLRNIAQNP